MRGKPETLPARVQKWRATQNVRIHTWDRDGSVWATFANGPLAGEAYAFGYDDQEAIHNLLGALAEFEEDPTAAASRYFS